ncbi:DNA-protecting protein DprA [Sulfurimonas sp. MAG313]|nr:DNA-processing protein DprA [Sulfurimonas sp. MAG313]MDF1880373.1 DNA-protecting protein DprA [Sulfurimonas sp. MAG313]
MLSSEVLYPLPSEFDTLKNPPSKIFYKGKTSLLNARKVSIVGARKAYAYSRNMTQTLARELSKRGVSVISGAAMGIDALAHEGAFPNTIAVLANGLDIIYPKVNRNLLAKMAESSLILSEYEDGEKARAYSFVHRNRLVVALGEVLVVAQADLNSGSMRSVEFALEMGKKIYVLPHRMDESQATLKLLDEGKAELITNIKNFADKFGSLHEERDPFLQFCSKSPTYEEVLAFDSNKLFEYELLGKIKVLNGNVFLNNL